MPTLAARESEKLHLISFASVWKEIKEYGSDTPSANKQNMPQWYNNRNKAYLYFYDEF